MYSVLRCAEIAELSGLFLVPDEFFRARLDFNQMSGCKEAGENAGKLMHRARARACGQPWDHPLQTTAAAACEGSSIY